jgi:4-alpha-glucanotransferase
MQGHFETIQSKVDRGLQRLGIRNLLLGIHDAAIPGLPEEDLGRGSPYSGGAVEFFRFARSLGFTGIQFGPQGITTPANPSPYDGTLFSRNPLSLSPLKLTQPPWDLLARDTLATLTAQRPSAITRCQGSFNAMAMARIIAEICRHNQQTGKRQKTPAAVHLQGSFARFRQRHAAWLERDALYQVLRQGYGNKHWKDWGEGEEALLDRQLFSPPPGLKKAAARQIRTLFHLHRRTIEEYCFIQFLLAEQHRRCREDCRQLGLKLFGDCQIGLSGRDAWYAQSFLLRGYVMGAPPSRTNPSGQPWNYPVPDPRKYYLVDRQGRRQPGPAVRFLRQRIDKLLSEFDGLRIDHPHGLVCPWVYRAGQKDPVRAVQQGARLFASPALADHPELAAFAIPRPDQLNPRAKRYDNHWVVSLDPGQIDRYAALFDVVMESARSNCRNACEIACEILSTQPYPIQRVMERYGLGRFRVTQKADLNNPADVYRSENARPEDWLMLGNHDTPSIWQVAEKWVRSGTASQQAAYLAGRLRIAEKERSRWIERTAADAGRLVQAKFADLFIGPGKNIMVFFTDLFGIKEAYNRPGTFSEDNWSLRIGPDYQNRYPTLAVRRRALDIPGALAMALRAQGFGPGDRR